MRSTFFLFCFSIRVLGFLLNVSLGGSYVSHAASERLRKKRFGLTLKDLRAVRGGGDYLMVKYSKITNRRES